MKSKITKCFIISTALLFSTLIINGLVFSQNTINVPDDYATIQEAVYYANENDTVTITSGDYQESLNIIKSIIFKGESVVISGDSLLIRPNICLRFVGSFTISGKLILKDEDFCKATFINYGELVLEQPIIIEHKMTFNKWCYVSAPIQNSTASIFINTYISYFNEPEGIYVEIDDPETPLEAGRGYVVYIINSNDTLISFE